MGAKNDVSFLLKQRESELLLLRSIQECIVHKKDVQTIFELVGDKIQEIFDSQIVMINTFDLPNDEEEIKYCIENGTRLLPIKRKIDKLRRKLIEERKSILINTNFLETVSKILQSELIPLPNSNLPLSAIYLPLTNGNSIMGYVSLQSLDKENAFGEEDVAFLNSIINSLSIALENALLFDETNQLLSETKQRNAELGIINSIQDGLSKELDLQAIYDLIGDKIQEVFDAQTVMITTFNHIDKTEHFNYMIEKGDRYFPEDRKYDKLRTAIIETGTEQLISNQKDVEKWWGKVTFGVGNTLMMKSGVFVPLMLGNKVKGYISLQNIDHEYAFNDSDVSLLKILANSMSAAIENARLFDETNRLLKETESRNSELAVINSVQQGLAHELNLQAIYDLVGDKLMSVFNAQVVIISTLDLEKNIDAIKYVIEKGERFFPNPRPLDKCRTHIAKTGETMFFKKLKDVEEWFGVNNAIEGDSMKCGIFMPLSNGNKVNGYISLQNVDKEDVFTESDVSLLQTLANSMSVSIENARLFDETNRLLNETEQRTAELAIINSVQVELAKELDAKGIYELVGEKIREILKAEVVDIVTYDKAKNLIFDVYAYEKGDQTLLTPREPKGFRKYVIENPGVLLINEDKENASLKYNNKVLIGEGSKSLVFVPMIVADEVRAIISVQNLEKEYAFSESDVRLLSTFANTMSVALENARLFGETVQKTEELGIINSLQEALAKELEVKGIFELAGDKVCNILNASSFIIRTFDVENDIETIEYAVEYNERFYVDPQPIAWANKILLETKQDVIINEKYLETSLQVNPYAIVHGKLPKSAIFIPMIVGNNIIGSVSLQNVEIEFAFSESDIRLMKTVANTMSVAIENAQLFIKTNQLLAETEQKNDELAVINSVQDGLVREMDLQGIYKLVGERICDVLKSNSFVIRTFDNENNLEIWEFAVENGEPLYVPPKEIIWVNKILIEKKQPIIINENYEEFAMQHDRHKVIIGQSPKSAIFIPMIVGDTVMGSVSIQNTEKENAYNDSDIRLLNTLTNSMSVAMENAMLFNETNRLLEQTKQRAAEMQTVNQISSALVSQLELNSLIKLVGEQMQDTFKADIVYVAMHDRKTNMLHFPYVYGDSIASRTFGSNITETIITNKEPILLNEDIQSYYNKLQINRKGKLAQSLIAVPIISNQIAIGVISIQSTQEGKSFNQNDQRLLSTIAANVGIAMHNAEAYLDLQEALTNLKSVQEQLVQQEKLAGLGQLAAGIAHEIKNPLNFVNNFSELNVELIDEMNVEIEKGNLIDAKLIAKDIRDNQEKIVHHGKRADAIVKSMLQHSRSSTGTKEATDINALADEYLRLAYHGLRAKDKSFNATMNTSFDESIKSIQVISQDIGRVILNLITNSFYAIDEKKKKLGGNYSPTLSVTTKKLNNKVEIIIWDNGNGIPKKLIDKVFQPFFTTKPTGEGTGLGLSLSYDIIKAHGGELKINTEENEFTEISILLPEI